MVAALPMEFPGILAHGQYRTPPKVAADWALACAVWRGNTTCPLMANGSGRQAGGCGCGCRPRNPADAPS